MQFLIRENEGTAAKPPSLPRLRFLLLLFARDEQKQPVYKLVNKRGITILPDPDLITLGFYDKLLLLQKLIHNKNLKSPFF